MKLRNGTVLPTGLVGSSAASRASAFNKSYKNYAIRAGVIVKRHEMSDKNNLHKLAVEYDVLVMEQDENGGSTPILYKHCLSVDGLGAIADFFEKKFRPQKKSSKKNRGADFPDQDGAIVLLMCLDGAGEKGIIVGGLRHPDRKTKLTGKDEILAAEYNGVAITINENGSCNLTFKGATNNDGTPKDKEQGNTTVDIEKDGSVQIKNKGVTQRMEKKGKYSVKSEDSQTFTAKKQISLNTDDKFLVKAKSDASMEMVNLAIKASGSATMEMQSLDIQSKGEATLKAQMVSVEAQSLAKVKASQVVIEGLVNLGSAGGTPALIMSTQFLGIGNLGIPVISQAIGPFSTKVTLI
jgi:hypothetical protein